MIEAVTHIALVVPDLRAAEAYYEQLFDMELIGREAELAEGAWYTLPRDKGWADADAAGIELGMLALRQGRFVLALFQGERCSGQVHAIGLEMTPEDTARLRARIPAGAQVFDEPGDAFSFQDHYQIVWQIKAPGGAFLTAGDWAGRWIDVNQKPAVGGVR